MHKVGCDLVEETLIVGDQQSGIVCRGQLINTTSNDPQRIDIQSGVGFIKDRHHGVEERHLQDFIALLLATGEAFIHAALEKGRVHLHHIEALAHVILKIEGVELLQPLLLTPCVAGNAQKLQIANTRNLNGILETKKNP